MKAALFLTLTLSLPLAFAQTDSDSVVTKIVRVRSDADLLARMVHSVTGANINGARTLGVVIISGKSSDVARLEQTVHDLDVGDQTGVKSTNVELTAYVLVGFSDREQGTPVDPPVEALTPVIRQLRGSLPYKQYMTLGTLVLHSASDSFAKVSGMLKPVKNEDASGPILVEVVFDSATVGGNDTVHLHKFGFSAKFPMVTPRPSKLPQPSVEFATTQPQKAPVELNADIDLRENQKVVVTQSNIGYDGDSLFLVLSAHVVR